VLESVAVRAARRGRRCRTKRATDGYKGTESRPSTATKLDLEISSGGGGSEATEDNTAEQRKGAARQNGGRVLERT